MDERIDVLSVSSVHPLIKTDHRLWLFNVRRQCRSAAVPPIYKVAPSRQNRLYQYISSARNSSSASNIIQDNCLKCFTQNICKRQMWSQIFRAHLNRELSLTKLRKEKYLRFQLIGVNQTCKSGGAAIAEWIRLRLPSCGPGFESQARHLCFL